MGKILKTDNPHYSYGVKDNYNIHIMRVSRWIKVETKTITKRSRFWDYADSYTEENGKRIINVFRFNNRWYCLDQFLRFSYPVFYTENEKKNFLSGYDCTDYYYPLEIEIDECGEYVRLYRELKENEYTEEMKEGRFKAWEKY